MFINQFLVIIYSITTSHKHQQRRENIKSFYCFSVTGAFPGADSEITSEEHVEYSPIDSIEPPVKFKATYFLPKETLVVRVTNKEFVVVA